MITWTEQRQIGAEQTLGEGVCLSTDTKPTGDSIANGSRLMEIDTSKLYFYDAESETWKEWG